LELGRFNLGHIRKTRSKGKTCLNEPLTWEDRFRRLDSQGRVDGKVGADDGLGDACGFGHIEGPPLGFLALACTRLDDVPNDGKGLPDIFLTKGGEVRFPLCLPRC